MKRDDIPDLVYDAERITPKPDQFNGSTPVLELFAYVLNEIENIQIGESFLIRDLFKGYIWNRLFQNQKTELGRWVSDYLDLMSNDFEGGRYLSYEGKTKQKQMIMRIVDDYEERKNVPRKISAKGVPKAEQFNGDSEAYKEAFYRAILERRSKRN